MGEDLVFGDERRRRQDRLTPVPCPGPLALGGRRVDQVAHAAILAERASVRKTATGWAIANYTS